MSVKGSFLRRYLRSWRKMGTNVVRSSVWKMLRDWDLLACVRVEEFSVPKDVPKDHFVVYVGKECKRFVIKVNLLNHPLFKQLLHEAEQVFGFATNARLQIPCDEYIFSCVLHHIHSKTDNVGHFEDKNAFSRDYFDLNLDVINIRDTIL
ncbi:Small auxin-up RNA [Dillenia turbinata]|uniref:Small auxin-up RNA n=1 Tax=Dillenia turbinata TaxID=194707 RepID=A0AAN8VNX6_9MAGN